MKSIQPPVRILLGPGPSEPHPDVLQAQSKPMLGHLDPVFMQILLETQDALRKVFQTRNEHTLAVSGTGMAGMECVFANLIEPGDKVLICAAGFFGERMGDIAKRSRANVEVVRATWGTSFDQEAIQSALAQYQPKVMGIVHAETSTGACQPLQDLGRLCQTHNTLLVVDAVTSLATIPLKVDEWQIDAVYSGSQKGLGCPPGLAPVSMNERAITKVRQRKQPVQSYYLDILELMKYWSSAPAYHHTAPITSFYALHEGLKLVLQEGLETRWQRHQRNWQALKSGLLQLGLKLLTDESCQMPALTAVEIPSGIDDLTIRKKLLNEYGIEIGGGLGPLKGKIWRIGLMGYGSSIQNVEKFLSAMQKCLN
ncbi:MAG: alanine--glyoxylate aminotransferase family protein [Planctomycetia bacterium]|nr:alanine--glyoxylate aminotransferase family protein [Planctomycetia bacterium]